MMMQAFFRPLAFAVAAMVLGATPAVRAAVITPELAAAMEKNVTQGALRIVEDGGKIVECPLKHTDVKADISGFLARVKVTQTFQNPTKEKIEAIYVFPLPNEAAVDDMTMLVGQRKIVGQIKKRAEARAIYDAALSAGQTAALLEQERPNIFTQTVGNIEPGQEVKIEISYVDVLKYDVGNYEFHFPMVVGPRYIPGTPSGGPPAGQPAELQGKVSPPVANTDQVPDASKISPPVLKDEFRTSHDISLSVALDAGVPIQNLSTVNHRSDITREGDRKAKLRIAATDKLPNKDFVFRYGVVGKKPEMAMLSHTGAYSADAKRMGEGYFMLMVQPKEDERLLKSPPREIVFLIDVSGSMSGAPTQACQRLMQHMLKQCREGKDTVQVITFATQAARLFDKALPVTEANIGRAVNFTQNLRGGGGTEMLKGVQAAINDPLDKERMRIVVMLTDGFIGNEAAIIEHVGKHCGDQVRFWAVGIGSAPNMFLIDGVAKQGGGMGKRLALEDDSVGLAQEIMTRIQRAQLAKVQIDWGNLKVSETFPTKIPELWAGAPIVIHGRYQGGGEAEITLRGSVEGEAVTWPVAVSLSAKEPLHDVLAKVWARKKIEDLMQQTYYFGSPAVEEAVTALALDYRLMSQYTSFVAVDTSKQAASSEPAARPRQMLVPVPLPEGTSWEGIFGGDEARREGEYLEAMTGYFQPLGGGAGGAGHPGAAAAPADDRVRKLMKRSPAAPPGMMNGLAKGPVAPGPQARSGMVRDGRERGAAAEKSLRNDGVQKRSGTLGDAYMGDNKARFKDAGGFVARANQLLQEKGDLAEGGKAGEKKQQPGTPSGEMLAGAEAEKKNDLSLARSHFVRAYVLDMAAANIGLSAGDQAAMTLASIEALDQRISAEWIKQRPALGTRLNLVLRDKSIPEALAEIAKASGLTVELLDGSLADVAALVPSREVRISYLDLRRATAAEALDFVLKPYRLEWWPGGAKVAAGSSRRRDGLTPWVYDVAALSLPTEEELAKERSKAQDLMIASAGAFTTAVQGELKLENKDVLWFAPGQLIVFADSKKHQSVAELFGNLAKPDFKPVHEATKKLAPLAVLRTKAHQLQLARQQEALRRSTVAAVHDQFSWQLLAAASAGHLDVEALTELTIAWHGAETQHLLKGSDTHVILRSWWTIAEAARALPGEAELASLAQFAAAQSRDAAKRAATAVENHVDPGAQLSVVYAALAEREQPEVRTKILELAGKMHEKMPIKSVIDSLFKSSAKGERVWLERQLALKGWQGPDLTVLGAMACRRAGGEVWESYRGQTRELLGHQPLPGGVVLLVNQLNVPIWPWLAETP